MSRDLGREVPGSERLHARNLWADYPLFCLFFSSFFQCFANVSCTFWISGLFYSVAGPRGRNHNVHFIRVARLQNEVGTKYFSRHNIFSRKMLPFFPEIVEPLFCGSEKIPQNSRQKIPQNFPPKKSPKKSPTSFCRSAGRTFHGLRPLESLSLFF